MSWAASPHLLDAFIQLFHVRPTILLLLFYIIYTYTHTHTENNKKRMFFVDIKETQQNALIS